MTQLEEYVIGYRDEHGDIVCNLSDYYAKYIVPLDRKFEGHYLGSHSLALCPLHDDHDPSLGMILSRKLKGTYRFNCLGCGRSGTIVRFHQSIQEIYHNRRLTTKEACLDLCELFGIPIPDLNTFADEDYEAKFYQTVRDLTVKSNAYHRKAYADELLRIRMRSGGDKVSLDAVNRASVRMIATRKDLYS